MSESVAIATEAQSSTKAKNRARKRVPYVGLGFISIFLIVVIFGNWISPYDYDYWDMGNITQPPVWLEDGSWEHILGTDPLGRDVLSRIIHGARYSLAIAVGCIMVYGTIGIILGLTSGFLGGKVDMVIMRICDLWMGLPPIITALMVVAAMGPSSKAIIIYIGISAWPGYTRIVRGECMSVAQNDFIRLAVVAGCSKFRIIVSHIFPNIVNTLTILVTLDIGGMIILTATLSFLGLGTQPPSPDWGLMMNEGRQYITYAWWLIVFPGVAIMFAVLGFNLVGDWLRDILDPKQKLR
ncbi:MAG: ABC transporter permease [Deltaproteobacteria bacterium]|nr:ABC transporter permease [Deltaproteobacteria bacterium]